MLKLKALLLTQGMHGMVSQVEGLAKGLKLAFKHQTIKLKPFWNYIPQKFTPISAIIYVLILKPFVCSFIYIYYIIDNLNFFSRYSLRFLSIDFDLNQKSMLSCQGIYFLIYLTSL